MPTPATKRALEKPEPVQKVLLTKPYDIVGKKRVFVIPATVHLDYENPPKSIEWVNQTGGPVTIWLPNGEHFLKPYEDPETQEVHKFITPFELGTKGELLLDVKENLPKGSYEYNVYCKVINDYAQGNSPPVMSCP
jgi:hypothetical protein